MVPIAVLIGVAEPMGRPLEASLIGLSLAIVAARELWVGFPIHIGVLFWPIPSDVLEGFILLALCAAHLILEKPNWQMFGVYFVSAMSISTTIIWNANPGICMIVCRWSL